MIEARQRFQVLVVLLIGACLPGAARAEDGAGSGVVYRSQEVRNGSPTYERLLYQMQVDHESGETVPWGNPEVALDGSRILAYFKSKNRAGGYRVCFRWGYFKTGGREESHRYTCQDWFDQKLHSIVLLSAEEAERIGTFVLHMYDVKGQGEWDGSGDPPGLLAHEYVSYRFVRGQQSASNRGASPGPDHSARIRELEAEVERAESDHRSALFRVQTASYLAAIPGADLSPMFQAQSDVLAATSRLTSLRSELLRLKLEQGRIESERAARNSSQASRGTGERASASPSGSSMPMMVYPAVPAMGAPDRGGSMRGYLCQKCQENVASACRHMNDPNMLGTTAAGFASLCAKGCWNECQ